MKKILDEYVIKNRITDSQTYLDIRKSWDRIAKPLDSLGRFEDIHARIGAIQNQKYPKADKCLLMVFCADNGIVDEGISQSGQEVTALCCKSISEGKSCAAIMAASNNVDTLVVNVGVKMEVDTSSPNYRPEIIAKGTRNFAKEPAMTMEETEAAIKLGIRLVGEYKEKGYDLILVGEMGIGNTTTSAAIASSLLKCKSEEVTGRGAGLSDRGLEKKIRVIQEAIDKYGLYDRDALTILSTVGGFDIASMVGVYLGAFIHGIPVVLDGVISMVAALVAEEIMPGISQYLIPSHISREPAAKKIAGALGISPVITADMALGEGTGALMLIPMLRTIIEVFNKSASFDGIGVEQYERNK